MNKRNPDVTEREELEQEKRELAIKIGIWDDFKPAENYQQTKEFKRIEEIDKRLFEIINGEG